MIDHPTLKAWVDEVVALCRPESVHLCDGSKAEFESLAQALIDSKTFVRLKRPGSFWSHSTPDDVARVEEATFICSLKEEDAGPTNHWKDPQEMKKILTPLLKGCMQGRVLYVIPFCLGPLHSPFSRFGVQITDSAYVVCNMHIMTRMGANVLEAMKGKYFVPCLHSVGAPLKPGETDVSWPCSKKDKYIVHFPEEKRVISFGSGYGGNALLGKKSFALRIGSVLGRKEGWLAEHMLIMGVTNPEGKKKYFAAAFPSACGKTNLAMLKSALPGWKVECVGDDIAWMHFRQDGRLYAVNPEFGFFGVAPGTSYASNGYAMDTIKKDTIFTNVALTPEGDVWWEGMTEVPPPKLTDWQGQSWTPDSGRVAAHPNARFTAPASQCPVIDPAWQDPTGVPISGIIFGGRRADTIPLVYESRDWNHGVFLGASISSETTAAAKGVLGKLRHDPFAMLPFCGYHMGDYFAHWIQEGKKGTAKTLPHIFSVNWFRKKDGKFLWPGFGDNIRVIKWMFERIDGAKEGVSSPIGILPQPEDIDLSGLKIEKGQLAEALKVNPVEWKQEAKTLEDYFPLFGNKLPPEIKEQLAILKKNFI